MVKILDLFLKHLRRRVTANDRYQLITRSVGKFDLRLLEQRLFDLFVIDAGDGHVDRQFGRSLGLFGLFEVDKHEGARDDHQPQ